MIEFDKNEIRACSPKYKEHWIEERVWKNLCLKSLSSKVSSKVCFQQIFTDKWVWLLKNFIGKKYQSSKYESNEALPPELNTPFNTKKGWKWILRPNRIWYIHYLTKCAAAFQACKLNWLAKIIFGVFYHYVSVQRYPDAFRKTFFLIPIRLCKPFANQSIK